jgi:hypothetical protein
VKSVSHKVYIVSEWILYDFVHFIDLKTYICDIKSVSAHGFTDNVIKTYRIEEVRIREFVILAMDK